MRQPGALGFIRNVLVRRIYNESAFSAYGELQDDVRHALHGDELDIGNGNSLNRITPNRFN